MPRYLNKKFKRQYVCYKVLSRNEFPNGAYWYCNYNEIKDISYIVHFNCIAGNEKMIKMKELNRILNDIFIKLKTPDCISIVKNIQLLLSRLSTNYTTDPSISKFWKLTENNRDLMKTYFENNEMLLHNNVFLPYPGTYKNDKDKYTEDECLSKIKKSAKSDE